MPYERIYTEEGESCPGGGQMRWTISVEEPGLQSITSFIGIDETSTSHDAKDSLLLDVRAAKWLVKCLNEAIEIAEDAERKARARDHASRLRGAS